MSNRSKALSTSVAAGRAKERVKAAELTAKFVMLERRQELEKRTERLLLEEQLAVAHTRERAYAALEEKLHVLPVHPPPTVCHSPQFYPFPRPHPPLVPQAYYPPGQVDPTAAPYSQLSPCVPEFKMRQNERQNASEGVQEVLSQENRLTELLGEQQQQTLLLALTITKFTGNPSDFFTFHRAFESQIESKLKSYDLRLRYLEQYLEGERKELIKGCLHLHSQNGYAEAMKLLFEMYGDRYKIANAYIKKVNDWPCISQGDDQALDRFATFLTQCLSAMSELTFLSILDHPHNNQTMVRKLLLSLQDRWRRESSRHGVAGSITPCVC